MDATNNNAINRKIDAQDTHQDTHIDTHQDTHIEIIVNGQLHLVGQDETVAQLLQAFSIESRYVVVQLDGQIVPRDQFAGYVLHAGNKLEIITLAGGG
jgi:sulfur carrier protein